MVLKSLLLKNFPQNNDVIYLQNKHESFSVWFSDRILDSGKRWPAPTVNVWEFSSDISESLNCGFLYFSEICPPNKGTCASQLLIFINSVTQVLMNGSTKAVADAYLGYRS